MLFLKPHVRQKIYSQMSHNQMRLPISQVLQEKVLITDFIFYDQCVQGDWDFEILHFSTSKILTAAHYSQLLGYFILNMNETESHSPSLSKFLKQLLFVFNGAAKKRKKKRKQYIPETLQKTNRREASAAYWGESWGRTSQTFMPRHLNKKKRKQKKLSLGHQEG